ncbi:WD repeat-containing protein 44, partial [Spiromyces aspiralis]
MPQPSNGNTTVTTPSPHKEEDAAAAATGAVEAADMKAPSTALCASQTHMQTTASTSVSSSQLNRDDQNGGGAMGPENTDGGPGWEFDASELFSEYELFEPTPYRIYVGHTGDVLALSWSKNGFLLSASMDRTVRLWHPKRADCLSVFKHKDFVTSVAFHPLDDRYFISGSLDCKLRLWDIPARKIRIWTEVPDKQLITSVSFTSASGEQIVVGTYRGMCVFYSTQGLRIQKRFHARSSRGRNAKGSKITG